MVPPQLQPGQPPVFQPTTFASASSCFCPDVCGTASGRVGLRAVLAVVSQAHSLERLGLADNWLDNQLVRELASAVAELPKLHYLDLSRGQGFRLDLPPPPM